MKIKHVSFDLWKTIIVSNPNFRNARMNFLVNDFITKEFSEEIIQNAINKISPLGDLYGEFFETGFTPRQLYYLFLHQLYGKETTKIIKDTNALEILYNESLQIFTENIPPLISNHFPEILEHLKNKGITTNIASNTSFAGGQHLRKCLEYHKLEFNFTLFSDEIGVFKPNFLFFENIYKRLRYISDVKNSKEILHVGDNPHADIQGATQAGFQALLFTPETPNYNQILEYV